jgi:proteasome lid subunit RPN8/RPN11
VTVVSITDEMYARRLGPVGLVAVAALRRRVIDQELDLRRRVIEDQAHARDRNPNPRPIVEATSVPRGKDPSSDRRIDFRPQARADFVIRLDGRTADHIRAEINDVAPYGVETGGFLYAHQPNRHFSTLVCLVTGPGPNSRHSRNRLRLSHPSEVEAEFPDWLPAENFVRVGDFHSHPTGQSTPSRTDMEAWTGTLRQRRQSTYVSIIVTPSPGDGSGPQLHGWVTRMDSYGTSFVVEPARIEA